MPNQIVIDVGDDNTLAFHADTPVSIDSAVTIFLSIIQGIMEDAVDHAPEGKEEECRGTLYDFFNVAASRLLSSFAPELELRPNLTALAIKEAEDRIILEGRLGEVAEGT